MCSSEYSKVLIGNDKMILCRAVDLRKTNINMLIKKAFPELLAGLGKIRRALKEIPYKIECCYKTYSSQFDCQVGPLEKSHNWGEEPFVALRVFEKDGKTYCSAEPVTT